MEFCEIIKWIKQQETPEFTIRDISRAVLFGKSQSCVEKVKKYLSSMSSLSEASLPKVAKFLYMSERSLSRSLRKQGTSYRELLNKERVKRCEEFLEQKDLKGKEIAEYLGFSEPSYFYKWFKNTTQTSFSSINCNLAKKHCDNGD